MSTRLQALRAKLASVKEEARAITASADKAGIDLTDEQNEQIDAFLVQADTINADIVREEKMADLDRIAKPADKEAVKVITGIKDLKENDKKAGFKNYGDFAASVMTAQVHGSLDPRLIGAATPSTYSNEGTGADGGFLVPDEFANTIKEHSLESDAFLPLTDNTPLEGNSMSFPRDETTPWGSNGVRAYWENEVAAATETKAVLGVNNMRLNKLMALVPVTDELISDTSALSSYLMKKTGSSIKWKANDAIINGNGAGKPMGILNAAALVSVAKETSQTAATVNSTNVLKMFARMPAENLSTAVWIVNNNVIPQLQSMTIGDSPIWIPPTGLAGAPTFGTLLGRPVMISQCAQTLGTKGDIYFADFKSYNTITKAAGIDYQTSIHLYFDSGATAFRATFRLDGQPWLTSSITPNNGSDNLSPFITLATRS